MTLHRLLLIALLILQGCDDDPGPDGDADADSDADAPLDDLTEALLAIDGLTVAEIMRPNPYLRAFELTFRQPVDHDDPEGPSFEQRMTLLHRDVEAPFVLTTTGYAEQLVTTQTELTTLLSANQLAFEHRYFGESRPDPLEWEYLTIEQAAADSHRLVEAFRALYTGALISAGSSKGGMTSVYHRRFYPDDVDGTVAYAAPISYGVPDERYITFVDTIGEQACRDALVVLQQEALRRRVAIVEMMEAYVEIGESYDRLGGLDHALETILISTPFTFWQYIGGEGCSTIPSVTSNDREIYQFIDDTVGFVYVSDRSFDFYGPYYYQAHTELGYPAHRVDQLDGLLQHEVISVEEGLLPEGATATFDGSAMEDIAEWVDTEGSELIFIYGEYDAWTAGAFELGGATDSYLFVAPGGTHDALIDDLSEEDNALALEVLSNWTGVEQL